MNKFLKFRWLLCQGVTIFNLNFYGLTCSCNKNNFYSELLAALVSYRRWFLQRNIAFACTFSYKSLTAWLRIQLKSCVASKHHGWSKVSCAFSGAFKMWKITCRKHVEIPRRRLLPRLPRFRVENLLFSLQSWTLPCHGTVRNNHVVIHEFLSDKLICLLLFVIFCVYFCVNKNWNFFIVLLLE